MPATILVADDHEEMRSLVVTVLEGQGYEVRQATDTQGVLDAVAAEHPDLLILDVHMPGAGGVAALREIRDDPATKDMRVLLLSGSVDLAAHGPKELGADAHLPKPFAIDELNQTVTSLLER
jgi:CheY-like chemotaxis protein